MNGLSGFWYLLPNGYEVPRELVSDVMARVKKISRYVDARHARADLIHMCQSRENKPSRESSVRILRNIGMTDDQGRVITDDARYVVLAAAVGEGLDVRFTWPEEQVSREAA